MLFLILFVQMLFDYGRIIIVREDSRNVLKSELGAVGFVLKHPGATLGLFYLILIVHIIITVAYILIQSLVPQSTFPGILTAFVIQQIFIFLIIWIRCWLYSSQMELYKYLK